MKRSTAREAAFLFAYQRTVRTDAIEELIASAAEGENEELRLNDFGRELVALCDEKTEELDAVISRHLENWKITRLPRLTLAALRLAACEMLYRPDVPVAVTVNEAVEFLKKYASPEDAAFANGVLGGIAKNERVLDCENTAGEE